jgi:hypothetical protein
MTDFKPPIAVSPAAALVAGHVLQPSIFDKQPPIASIPAAGAGFTVTGPTGGVVVMSAVPVIDAVTGSKYDVRPKGPVGVIYRGK